MTRHHLRVPWAGPAVAAALLFSPLAVQSVAAAPVAAARVVQLPRLPCMNEAGAYGAAVGQWIGAWSNYEMTLPGGTAEEIQRAVDQLNRATDKVVETGIRLAVCLMKNYL